MATMVTRLLWPPNLPEESNSTTNSAVLPGAIGSLGQLGVVHPQDALASAMINGSLPVFLNLNTWRALAPALIFPKAETEIQRFAFLKF